jgi:hypothetical protein
MDMSHCHPYESIGVAEGFDTVAVIAEASYQCYLKAFAALDHYQVLRCTDWLNAGPNGLFQVGQAYCHRTNPDPPPPPECGSVP